MPTGKIFMLSVLLKWNYLRIGLNPKRRKLCGFGNCGVPTKLETNGATFFLVRQKQGDTLRFLVYFIGSAMETKNYSYNLSIADKAGKEKYDFQGKVYTLDKDEPIKGITNKFKIMLRSMEEKISWFQGFNGSEFEVRIPATALESLNFIFLFKFARRQGWF